MQKYPNCIQMYDYDDSIAHNTVINISELTDNVYIRLPENMSQFLTLESVTLLFTNDTIDPEAITRDRSWIIIPTSKLRTSIGYYIYQFSFLDNRIGLHVKYYITYQIQSDNPEKPYVYMER